MTKPLNGDPATVANGSTIGFSCENPEQADLFHDTAVANGGQSIEDPPGWREPSPGRKIYLAYVSDPSVINYARYATANSLFNKYDIRASRTRYKTMLYRSFSMLKGKVLEALHLPP